MVCYVVVNMVPYHAARLRAVASLGAFQVCVLQLRKHDPFRALEFNNEETGFRTHTLPPPQTWAANSLRTQISEALHALAPGVVCLNGWGLPGSLSVAEWCLANRKPMILLSDSSERDLPRKWPSELFKSLIVRACRAALVGGSRNEDYLVKLGMPRDRVFLGYDVVDNDHFAEGASEARRQAQSERARLGLPPEYFLICSRFSVKKNIPMVITAYARYHTLTKRPWPLILVGGGELRPLLSGLVESLGLQGSVTLAGEKGYSELPAYYGLAGCFIQASTTEQWGLVINEAMAAGLPILASERCGCSPELVQDDVNGYVFDPTDSGRLAHLMQRVAADSDLRKRFGEASASLISKWDPRRFATGLVSAVRVCQGEGRRHNATIDRLLIRGLAYARDRRMI